MHVQCQIYRKTNHTALAAITIQGGNDPNFYVDSGDITH